MEEKEAFYVVRKGDVIGVYKNLSDCQDQAGSSVCNPSMSVYKGIGLPKEAEEYLASKGLKNATYSIRANDVTDDLFGKLVACPFQQPASFKGKHSDKDSSQKRLQEALTIPYAYVGLISGGPSYVPDPTEVPQRKNLKLDNCIDAQPVLSNCDSCTLEFDGASKGNPGLSGAGAVLRAKDGSMVYRFREGVGIATNNVAEYRAVILGLRCALKKGFKHICVQGDSKLVCMQIQGLWKTKNQNMADLCKEAKALKDKFVSFKIEHVLRDFNSEADAQANLAINLKDGEVREECEEKKAQMFGTSSYTHF